MSISVPIKPLVTGSVLDLIVGKDLNESWNSMPTYLFIAQPSLNVTSAPTKIQIPETCVPIKENTVMSKVLFVKCVDKHSHGLNSLGVI